MNYPYFGYVLRKSWRIYRMLFDDFWWGVGDFYLSESGCPGFADLQDVIG
jgi:hypothetical protein